MQVFFSYIICPECHTRNTPWRSFCKKCRGPLQSRGRQSLIQTDITLTIYRARDPQTLLLISPQFIGFETAGLAIQSAWENIESLRSEKSGPYFGLRRSAALSLDPARVPNALHASRRIPLWPFGFPEHAVLREDLRRFLPERVSRKMSL